MSAAEPAIAEVTLPAGVSSLDDLIGASTAAARSRCECQAAAVPNTVLVPASARAPARIRPGHSRAAVSRSCRIWLPARMAAGRPKDDVVELLKAANPDFEVPACHFAKGYKVKHDPRLIRVIYNTDGTVREFKRH